MLEMEYRTERIVLCLDKGIIDGFNYVIMSYGTHPCCYIQIPKEHRYYKKNYDDIDINCHGGLTFSKSDLYFNPTESWWIGWDYAHGNDYMGYYGLDCLKGFDHSNDKKWTTQELLNDVKDVIKQLKEEQCRYGNSL